METLQNVEDEQSVAFSSPPQGIDLGDFDDKLRASIQLLPSCQRCKRLRRKCDTNLPSCRLCQKANVECSFYDHSLQQVLPRSYVLSLLTRAQELKEAKKLSANKASLPAVSPSSVAPVSNTAPGVETVFARHKPSQDNFDEHFMLTTPTNSTSRFFGSSSVFVLTVRLASRVFDDFSLFQSPENPIFDLTEVEGGINDPNLVLKSRISIYSREMLLTLTGHYMSSLNTLYPFIDEFTISHDLEVFLDNQINEASGPSKLSGKTAYQYFRIAMICAIACANKSRHKPHLVASDDDFYAKGMRYVEAVTSEVSGESLQALMLLIVYCLFHPRKGDIWKLLDYACRLSVELGYHTELPSDEDSSRDMSLRRSTFWGLYTIERIVGQIFGRPSDLPEQIITTEYPGILVTGSPTDRASVQVFSAAHHYRLVYLRSEIYREIYLPTSPFVHDLEWFIDRYFTLSQWYEEIQINEELAGVGTSTCNVAYHSTIVFLFQPLLLRALSETSKLNLRPTTLRVTPSENYRSACQLIRTYERIMRAPDDTALGIYAMTIMSAHYIYLAGLTIITHAHLSIDGQIKTLSPLIPGVSERTTQPIDYSEIYEVSGSCLVLLTWCASTWKGMSGMLDMYKRLSEKLLPMLAGKGLV